MILDSKQQFVRERVSELTDDEISKITGGSLVFGARSLGENIGMGIYSGEVGKEEERESFRHKIGGYMIIL